ncbi:uncharacterized protein LOC113233059 [Hyposmocoma kahamanoa]|uniref:uncharacterized protein LOC113233059 n=1 Tax=Hyposmocoma kahamanoa TaxID=1477025 RepID=UPI000E6D8B3B|nr:uncharacterized protein LOC113233059 [Hyposmocoma kahamanoa]
MSVGGRVRCAAVGVIAGLVYLFATFKMTLCYDYGVPVEIKLWDTGRTPLAHMVDVTNGFGLEVLAEHNFLNDNNIAFSPYGLMGILVALYEGVDSESSYQIQRAMQLPWNRNVMRIGFRDIHRTLKTYFVPEEGFLAGLALNNENVTFNEGYKKVLRFYGFDLDNNDQLPTLTSTNSTNGTTTAVPGVMTAAPAESGNTSTPVTSESPPAREDTSSTLTTLNPNAETLSDVDIRGPTPTTTISPSSAPNSESTTVLATLSPVNQETIVSAETSSKTTAQASTVITQANTTPMMTEVPIPDELTTTVLSNAPDETESIPATTSISIATAEEATVNNEVDVISTSDVSTTATQSTAAESTIQSTTESTSTESTTVVISETQETQTVSSTDITTNPTIATISNDSALETLERKKKSIVNFIYTNPPYVDDYLFYRSYDIPVVPDAPPGSNVDNSMFLVNGLRNVRVTYMNYDTILEYAYLPHLEASALRLPLDSERYYLLVILPTRGGAAELGRLLARMARESDLSDVYSTLRPRRVRAIVPSFTVKGHVTLTTDLQKLGIRDVFEPRQRDFTPMTHQPGVYVRSIEQAVSVAIRKYQPEDQKKNWYVTNQQPIKFMATYPFLYFVMDASIHVALMAGKMVDPLNSRIL